VILKSYLHIKTHHLVKIIPTTPTCFSLSRPSSGNFVLPYFEVANASMLNIWYCRSMSVINIPCNINVSGVLYSTPSIMQHIFIMVLQIPLGLLTCGCVGCACAPLLHTSKGAQAQPTQPHTCCCSTIYIKHRSISNFKIRQNKTT